MHCASTSTSCLLHHHACLMISLAWLALQAVLGLFVVICMLADEAELRWSSLTLLFGNLHFRGQVFFFFYQCDRKPTRYLTRLVSSKQLIISKASLLDNLTAFIGTFA